MQHSREKSHKTALYAQEIIHFSLGQAKIVIFLRIFYHIMNLILFLGEKSVFQAVQLVLPAAFLSNFVWRHILREKAGNIICHTNIIHFVCFLLVSLM